MDLQRIEIIGNVTRDPVRGTSKNGSEYALFTVACNRKYKDREGKFVENVTYYSIACSTNYTLAGANLVRKGSKVFIDGEPSIQKSKMKDGSDRYEMRIQAKNVNLLSQPKREEQPDTSFNVNEFDPEANSDY